MEEIRPEDFEEEYIQSPMAGVGRADRSDFCACGCAAVLLVHRQSLLICAF